MPRAPPVTSASLPSRRMARLQVAFDRPRGAARRRRPSGRAAARPAGGSSGQLDVPVAALRGGERLRGRAHTRAPAARGVRAARARGSTGGTGRSVRGSRRRAAWVVDDVAQAAHRDGAVGRPLAVRARDLRPPGALDRLGPLVAPRRQEPEAVARIGRYVPAAASSSSSSRMSPRATASAANAHSQRPSRVTRR